jgi:cytochrome c oxidase assembly protein subunit 11
MTSESTNGEPSARSKRVSRINRKMLSKLLVITVVMFGFGYGLVPVYRKICQITGVNYLTLKEDTANPANSQIDKSRFITVEFDGTSHGPWRFRPSVSSVKVHPGELTQVMYEVVNTQGRQMDAQAIPSYAPMEAGPFFKKVECFCFTQQTLAPHQAKEMPVVFYVDPKVPKNVTTITLSYTFFEVGGATIKSG